MGITSRNNIGGTLIDAEVRKNEDYQKREEQRQRQWERTRLREHWVELEEQKGEDFPKVPVMYRDKAEVTKNKSFHWRLATNSLPTLRNLQKWWKAAANRCAICDKIGKGKDDHWPICNKWPSEIQCEITDWWRKAAKEITGGNQGEKDLELFMLEFGMLRSIFDNPHVQIGYADSK